MRQFSLPLIIIGAILIAALLTWFTLDGRSFRSRDDGAGDSLAKPVPLGAFKNIDVSGQAEVKLVQGAEPSVQLQGPGEARSRMDVLIRGDTLYVVYADHQPWWSHLLGGNRGRTPEVAVTFRDLESLSTAGSVKVTAGAIHVPELRISGAGGTSLRIDDLQTKKLRVAGSGALKAELAGRATDLALTISGAGDYLGAHLVSENASVTVSGAGRIVVNVEKTLKATISGAGSVEYIGNPQVTRAVGGVGRVRRIESALPPGVRVARLE